MNAKLLLPILLLLIGFQTASPQSKMSPREMFLEAESYFLYEEFKEAAPLYSQLSVLFPRNDNINYRLGRCYLNIPYEKEKSILFLEKASKNINPKYKGESLKEQAAPQDVIYYLGDAYRVNNQLDKAIAQYKKFKQISDPAVFDHELIEDQIKACENAKILSKQPLNVTFTNLGENINSRYSESNAVVSGDESTMVYSAQLQFYPAVFYSQKINGVWSSPENINPDLGVDDDCFPVGISYDGKELLLYRNNQYLGDLYVSRLVNGKWSKIKKLNGNINTVYWESHGCFSKDGKKLFFTSNRKGSFGGLDIFVSTRQDVTQDNWGDPVNLGPLVNSHLHEETPFISPDERKLYFSSLGHNGMGGYDIFVSEINNGTWGAPQNVGCPINTTDDDLFFQPVRDGNEGYMAMLKKDTYGRNDIYKVKITTPATHLAAINQNLLKQENTSLRSDIKKEDKNGVVATQLNTDDVNTSKLSEDSEQPANTALISLSNKAQEDSVESEEESSSNTASINPQDSAASISERKSSMDDSSLTPGQKQAWHKMLYGGLGILAVFIIFILFLYRKSRKRKNQGS